jgi:uncharacterized protein
MEPAQIAAADGEIVRLERGECLRLLATAPAGRLIFTVNALPAVRVMNFALAGEMIVVRTAATSTAARRAAGAIVAFEADALDAAACSGWQVTVTGRAELVTDPEAAARYRTLGLVPWAPGPRETFLTISTEIVQGQRVGLPDRPQP